MESFKQKHTKKKKMALGLKYLKNSKFPKNLKQPLEFWT